MKKFEVRKGDMQDLPILMDMDTLYFGISSQEGGISAMCIDGKIWPSKEYIDNKIGEIEKLLEEL